MTVTARPLVGSGAVIGTSALRRHLNLTRELAITQFKLKYTGSVLGYLWSLFKPMMLFGITYAIFVYLFNVGRTSPHFALQLLVAIVLFTFFQEATATAMSSVAGTGHLIRKAHFPRSILVVASSLSAFITFLINMTLIIVVGSAIGQMDLGLRSLLTPLFIIELYALVLGFSLGLSALFVFYRDLGHIWEIVTQLLLYGSAVVYPYSLLTHGHRLLGQVVGLSPVAQIIEDVRHALVAGNLPYPPGVNYGSGPAVPWMASILGPATYLVPLSLVAAIVALGVTIFRRLEPRFAENL